MDQHADRGGKLIMALSFSNLLKLAQFTVMDPRAAARNLMAMNLPDAPRWMLLGLVVCASALLTHLGFNLLPTDETQFMADAIANPLRTAIMQGIFLLLTIAVVYGVGRWRGGKGSFSDALLLIGWLQFVLLCLQAAQVVALLVIPPVAEILGVLGLGLSFWLLTQFITELHGFKSAWRVFGVVMMALVAAAFAIAMVIVSVNGVGG